MKTQSFFVDFVKSYGIKEGIIISEVCRRACLSESGNYCFSVADCTRVFEYMTEKQIRTALKNLLERRCIRHADIKRSFDRTVRFQVSNEIYQAYFTAAVGGGLCVGIS